MIKAADGPRGPRAVLGSHKSGGAEGVAGRPSYGDERLASLNEMGPKFNYGEVRKITIHSVIDYINRNNNNRERRGTHDILKLKLEVAFPPLSAIEVQNIITAEMSNPGYRLLSGGLPGVGSTSSDGRTVRIELENFQRLTLGFGLTISFDGHAFL